MAVTLKTIGEKANVSVATVSRVLNNTDSSVKIGEKVRARVLAIAQDLNYVPNRMAQAMRTQRTNNIGVVFSRDLMVSLTADLFYMQILSRVEEIALDRGYNIVLSSIAAEDIEGGRLPSIVVQKMVDAVVVLRVFDEDYLAQLREACPATLLVDRAAPTVDCVASDNRGGMRQAVEHLYDLGHRRIGYVDAASAKTDSSFRDRLNGYHDAIAKRGLPSDDRLVVRSDVIGEGGCEAVGRLLGQSPDITAVVCANDKLAIHAMRYCQHHGVLVPDDLSIVGFDDIETSRHLTPPLTTIAVDKCELGEAAIEILFDRLGGGRSADAQPISRTIPVGIVVRESTSVPKALV